MSPVKKIHGHRSLHCSTVWDLECKFPSMLIEIHCNINNNLHFKYTIFVEFLCCSFCRKCKAQTQTQQSVCVCIHSVYIYLHIYIHYMYVYICLCIYTHITKITEE